MSMLSGTKFERRTCARGLRCAVLLMAGLLAACGGGKHDEPLRVGVLVWPPYELAFLARDLGYFKDGSIELLDYESPAVVQRAYRDGSIDAVFMTTHYLLDLAQTGGQHRVPLVIDASYGGDVLIAREGITDLAGLKGKKIAVESGSLGAYMLLRALDHAGLKLTDVARVSTDIPDQARKFASGDVDAVITYEPIRTELLQQGGQVLFDSSDIPNEILDVLIVRADTVEQRAHDLGLLVDGFLKALEYLQREPRDALARMAPRENLSPEELKTALELVRLPDRAENYTLLAQHQLRDSLAIQRDTMLRSGLLAGTVSVDGFADPRFIEAD